MRNRRFTLSYVFILLLGMAIPAVAQDDGVQQPSARQQLQRIHAPQSIDQELARLTKDLELNPEQQQVFAPVTTENFVRISTGSIWDMIATPSVRRDHFDRSHGARRCRCF